MKRLTFEGRFCDIAQCLKTPGGSYCEDGMCSQRKVWERLKAYEDAGLEPEGVQKLAQVGKEGRLVAFPCKVGDTVYWLHDGKITACRVHRVQQNRKGLYLCLRSIVTHGDFRADLIGKSIFLSRAEAEAAMGGAEDE